MNQSRPVKQQSGNTRPSRRQFVKVTGAAIAAGAVATSHLSVARAAHNSVDESLKIGLIGCGGRGKGAVANACNADPDVKVWALADAFEDRIDEAVEQMMVDIPQRMDVTKDRCFTGLDCHQGLIDSGVDVVLLCSPPYFRPMQMEAAAAAGKHIFCEKPIAVDAPGVRRVMEASKKCQEKGLSLVSGLCWRYDLGVNATIDVVKEGTIGDIRAIEANYYTAELWHRGTKPDWSDVEYQMRNWLYFAWLSGDITAEQHIHTLDKALWLMNDEPPVRCYGTGGRQKRTDKMYGTTFDHFASVFEWENGVKCFSHCRQMTGCWSENECHVIGTKGNARILKNIVDSNDGQWRYKGQSPSMYDVEHQHLFRSIRENKPINNGDYMCKSTMMAIMARQACYTGQEIEWNKMWNDGTILGPDKLAFGSYDPGPVPVPGQA